MEKKMSLIGQKAPDFTAQAVMENDEITEMNLHDYLDGDYGLIFFYPYDWRMQ